MHCYKFIVWDTYWIFLLFSILTALFLQNPSFICLLLFAHQCNIFFVLTLFILLLSVGFLQCIFKNLSSRLLFLLFYCSFIFYFIFQYCTVRRLPNLESWSLIYHYLLLLLVLHSSSFNFFSHLFSKAVIDYLSYVFLPQNYSF